MKLNMENVYDNLQCISSESVVLGGKEYTALIDLVEMEDDTEAYAARLEEYEEGADIAYPVGEAVYTTQAEAQKALKRFMRQAGR